MMWYGTATGQPEVVYARTNAGSWEVYRYPQSVLPHGAIHLGSDGVVRIALTTRSGTTTSTGTTYLLTSRPGVQPELEALAPVTGASDTARPRPMVHYSGPGRPELYVNGIGYHQTYDSQYTNDVWLQMNALSVWNTNPLIEEAFDTPNGDPMFLSTSGRILQSHACVPSCGTRVCGSDGCGGSCGQCGANNSCTPGGSCVPYRVEETPSSAGPMVVGDDIWLVQTSTGTYRRGGVGGWNDPEPYPITGSGYTRQQGNEIWAATNIGTWHFDGTNWQNWPSPIEYSSTFSVFTIDRNNLPHLFRQFIDTVYERIDHKAFNGTTWGSYATLQQEYHARPRDAWFESNNGIVMHWEFGQYDVYTGTVVWSPRLWRNYAPVPWPPYTVHFMFLDKYDRLNVIATSGSGVDWYRRHLDTQTWELLQDDFLPAYTVNGGAGRVRTFDIGPDGLLYVYMSYDPTAPTTTFTGGTHVFDIETGQKRYASYFYHRTSGVFAMGCPSAHYFYSQSGVASHLW
jgi:hypothetical protein